ncbi:hypothetical protein ACFLUJ_01010 [Chloroflexota bacterium]
MNRVLANLSVMAAVQDLEDYDPVIDLIDGISVREFKNKLLKFKDFVELNLIVKNDILFTSSTINTLILAVADLAEVVSKECTQLVPRKYWFSLD